MNKVKSVLQRLKANKETITRVVIAVILLAVAIAPSLVISNVMGYFALLAILITLIALFIWLRIISNGLSISIDVDAVNVVHGDTANLVVSITNSTPLYISRVDVFFEQIDGGDNILELANESVSLAPFEKIELNYELFCAHVGSFHVRADKVRVYDPVQLFSKVIDVQFETRLDVEPKVYQINLSDLEWSEDFEDDKAIRSVTNTGMDYTGVREYERGDLLRSIHWKLSARFEEQLTRIYTQSLMPSVTFVCDFSCNEIRPQYLLSMYDALLECLFSFELNALRKGFRAEIIYYDGVDYKTIDSHSKDDYMDIVLRMPALGSANDYEVADILTRLGSNAQCGSNIVVFTSNPSDKLSSSVAMLKSNRKNPSLVVVCPPDVRSSGRKDYLHECKSLVAVNIPVACISHATELAGGDVYEL